MPELIDVETTEVIERLETQPELDDDEPAALPPPPMVRARGSRTYQVPAVHVIQRVIMPRTSPVSPRRPQSRTPAEGEAIYEAVLRHYR